MASEELNVIGALAMGVLTGAIFGTALYKVSAIRYSRVEGMLLLADLKVMKFAFAAVAMASFGYGLAAITGTAETLNLVPRIMPFTGWAHILGGIIFGTSMAFIGCCPGTSVCRATTHLGSFKTESLFTVLGLFVGVGIFSMVKTPLFESGVLGAPEPLTLHGALGLPYGPVALVFGVLFLLLAGVLDSTAGEGDPVPNQPVKSVVDRIRGEWHWLPGGLLAGSVILFATYQDGFIGFSGSVLATYGWVADALGQSFSLVPTISEGIVWRIGLLLGVGVGAFLASLWSIKYQQVAADNPQAKKVFDAKGSGRAVVGGTGLALGAMIGGGCTTGAFMAAFPTLSLGSFAMGGTFFAAGIVASKIINRVQPIELLPRRRAYPAENAA